MSDLAQLQHAFNQLADANNWHPKHTVKNLAAAVSVEAAELLEIFQWLSDSELKTLSNYQQQQAADEIADVFLYLLCLADKLNIDIIDAAKSKMEKNKQRFSV